jgi:hypothetical protein
MWKARSMKIHRIDSTTASTKAASALEAMTLRKNHTRDSIVDHQYGLATISKEHLDAYLELATQ